MYVFIYTHLSLFDYVSDLLSIPRYSYFAYVILGMLIMLCYVVFAILWMLCYVELSMDVVIIVVPLFVIVHCWSLR